MIPVQKVPLSPIGGEGWGEGADSRALARKTLTHQPLARLVPPLPQCGREYCRRSL
jgi:hypothetical protein